MTVTSISTPTRQLRAERTEELVEALRLCATEAARERLEDELIQINMPVAQSVARRYRGRGIATEDLEQVAYLALVKATRRFDPQTGHAFLSFTVPTVRGEVRRYFRDKGWVVRPPRRVQELQSSAHRAQTDLTVELGRHPSELELAEHLGETIDDVREALDGRGCFSPASLDAPADEGAGSPLGDRLAAGGSPQAAAEARVALAPLVRRLADRDRRILRMRFVDDLTQREIADDIGVTQMQVSRLLSRIYRNLREELGELDELASPSLSPS